MLLSAQDKKAKKILDKLNESYTSSTTLTISFDLVVQYPDEEATTLPSKVIQKDKKFLFQNSEQEYYGNGDDIWIYIPSQNEVQINDFEEDDTEDYFITPLDLLNQYTNGQYEYKLTSQKKGLAEIEFKPLDEFSDYSKFRINVKLDKNEIEQIVAFGKDASRVDILITDVKRDLDYSDTTFEFDLSKYPDVHVEDLRLD